MNVRTVRKAGGVITVKKPHDIITVKFKLSAREQDLITLAMMEVKKDADSTKVVRGEFNRDIPDLKLEYSIPEEKVAELFDVSLKALKRPTENGISMLLNVCASLCSRTFIVSDGTGEGFVDGLVNFADYRDGRLLLVVSQKQAERMLDYGAKNNQFGIIDAKLLLSFNSAYTKRILELISRFKNKKDYTCTIGELCAMTGTDLAAHDNRADNFRRIVLDKPLKQIIERSNGVWTPKKGYQKGYHIDTVRGRKMTDKNIITFKMKYNEPVKEAEVVNADYSAVTMDELEAIFVDFVYSDTSELIPKEAFIAFSDKSMAHLSSFKDMSEALEWMGKANELKDAAVMKFTKLKVHFRLM